MKTYRIYKGGVQLKTRNFDYWSETDVIREYLEGRTCAVKIADSDNLACILREFNELVTLNRRGAGRAPVDLDVFLLEEITDDGEEETAAVLFAKADTLGDRYAMWLPDAIETIDRDDAATLEDALDVFRDCYMEYAENAYSNGLVPEDLEPWRSTLRDRETGREVSIVDAMGGYGALEDALNKRYMSAAWC